MKGVTSPGRRSSFLDCQEQTIFLPAPHSYGTQFSLEQLGPPSLLQRLNDASRRDDDGKKGVGNPWRELPTLLRIGLILSHVQDQGDARIPSDPQFKPFFCISTGMRGTGNPAWPRTSTIMRLVSK